MLSDVDLAQTLSECRAIGGLSDSALRAIERLARRSIAVYHSDIPMSDRDDVVQNVLLRFYRCWRRIDPRKNPTAYINSMLKTEAFRQRRRSYNRKKIIDYECEIPDRRNGQRLERAQKSALGGLCAACCRRKNGEGVV